jgi:CRISPR/Cas system CSM-associated protein Csm3 (group 7 of RAMP superfamily)
LCKYKPKNKYPCKERRKYITSDFSLVLVYQMFMRKIYCKSIFSFNLISDEPLLIKSGKPERGQPSSFFKAFNPVTMSDSWCIPGSSLKGVLRSYSERILRSFDEKYACDPLDENNSCSGSLKKVKESLEERGKSLNVVDIISLLCPICLLFGCTEYAGRVEVDDAFCSEKPEAEGQTGIAIDRFTGGVVNKKLFTRNPLTSFSFPASISIKNFQLWHIGLLALVLRDINREIAKLGSGKGTGYGGVAVNIKSVEFSYLNRAYKRSHGDEASCISGVSSMMRDEDIRFNGLVVEEPFETSKSQESEGDNLSLWKKYIFRKDRDDVDGLFEICVTDYLSPLLKNGFREV